MLRNLITINHYIFPDFINKYLNNMVLDRVTFIFSNLPGPLRKIDMGQNSRLTKILGFGSGLAKIGLFFIFFSYSDKITMCACSDKAVDFNTEEFTDLFMEIMKTEFGYDDVKYYQERRARH